KRSPSDTTRNAIPKIANPAVFSGTSVPLRYSTGVPGLDQHLGGGLLPGSLTVVVGATGIGKTQFGVQFAAAIGEGERRRGVILDVSSRGDSQSHADYARRLVNWNLVSDDQRTWDLSRFHAEPPPGD